MFGKKEFVSQGQGSLSDNYTIVKEIGSGSYGRVYRIKNKKSGEIRACKQLAKGRIANIDKFTSEINILTQMDHPNIIKLFEVYEDNRYIFLVMEECQGGELFDRIIDRVQKKKLFTEREAARIFKEMVAAICYCHSQNICHRDLKPENLLFLNTNDDAPLKIIDFGLSKTTKTDDNNKMTTKVGTAYYVAPEVLAGDYDEKCDIWSAGVILFILLCGEPPFNGPNDNDIYRKIQKKTFSFSQPIWDKVSQDAKDIIKWMLSDPEVRPSAEEVLAHTWVQNLAPNSTECILDLEVNTLQQYTKTNKFQKAVLTFIASRLRDDEIENLKQIFHAIDTNQDGTLTLEEVKSGISKLKETDIDIEEMFKQIDTDGSGSINYTEFLAATMDKKIYMKQEKLYEAFASFDKDKSGKISVDEIISIVKAESPEDIDLIKDCCRKYDVNNDGEIDYNEFLDMMTALRLN